jgi:hypothetical protein
MNRIPGNADTWIKEQPYFQDSSPDREPSLIPSSTHHADVERPRDKTPSASLQEREPEFYKNIARILMGEEELDSRIRKKLTKRGYTAKELETLKRTKARLRNKTTGH